MAQLRQKLSRFLLIEEEERPMALVFMGIFLLIGWGSAIGMGSGDVLFIKRYGIEYLPLLYMLLGPLLLLGSVFYAAIADSLPAEQVFYRMFLVFALLLLLAWSLIRFAGMDFIYPGYWLLTRVVGELLLVHGAFYLAQNMDTQQAKRLLPPIMAGTQLGGILGGLSLGQFSGHIAIPDFLLFWISGLAGAFWVMWRWHAVAGASRFHVGRRQTRGGTGGLFREVVHGVGLMRGSSLLRAMSLALFFLVLVFYVLSYAVHQVYNQSFATESALSAFYGWLMVATGGLALLLQLLVTNRVIHGLGVRAVNMLFPASVVAAFAGLAFSFALPLAIFASLAKDTLMPAFRDPVRDIFLHALPANIQGRARATSVMIVIPLALLVTGGLLWLFQVLDTGRWYLLFGLVASLCYLYSKWMMNRAYLREIIGSLRSRLYIPDVQWSRLHLRESDRQTLQMLEQGIRHEDEAVNLAYAELLLRIAPERGASLLQTRIPQLSPATQDRMLKLLAQYPVQGVAAFLATRLTEGDDHSRATAAVLLAEMRQESAIACIDEFFGSGNPRLQTAAIRIVHDLEIRRYHVQAGQIWATLLQSESPGALIAGLQLAHIGCEWLADDGTIRSGMHDAIQRCAADADERLLGSALQAQCHLGFADEAWGAAWLREALTHPALDVRRAAVHCARQLVAENRRRILLLALEDGHHQVRVEAAGLLFDDDEEAAWVFLRGREKVSPRGLAAVLDLLLENGRQQILHDLALMWAERAGYYHEMGAFLDTLDLPGAAARVLRLVLLERRNDFMDLALRAVARYEGEETVAVVRIGLKSDSAQQRGWAREVLQNLLSRQLGARLNALLEHPGSGVGRESLSDMLTKAMQEADSWLYSCLAQVRKEWNGNL